MPFYLVSAIYFKKMKIIKIILSTIIGLSLVFFTTGLIVNETVYDVEVSINKPVAITFSEFTQIQNSKQWIPDVKSIQVIEETPNRIGNAYNMLVDNNGEEFTIVEKIETYDPNTKFVVFFDAENMKKTNSFIFKSNGLTTTINLKASCKSDSYILNCVFPYFKTVFVQQDQRYLDNFKNYIENK